jgi:N-acyl-D-aspartate/D-glutamate deacylase
VRDRQLISIEEGVRALSHDTASFVGYANRGTVEVGSYADINVIDWDGLALDVPTIAHDFPGGAARFLQGATGIEHTLVNGVPFMENGRHTGATPGRILRSS